MNRYEAPELSVVELSVDDIIATSPVNLGTDTPYLGLDDGLLS